MFKKKYTETEFLPSVIEVEETPPSPIGRGILWSIMVLLAIFVIWSCIGKIDIVATGTGKIIPTDRVKIIQAMEKFKISKIHVKEGDLVKQGDRLIDFDDTGINAEVNKISELVNEKTDEKERLKSELKVSKSIKADYNVALTRELSLVSSISEQELLRIRIAEYFNELKSRELAHVQKESELKILKIEIQKDQQLLPIIVQRTSALKKLHARNMASKFKYYEEEEKRIELTNNLRLKKESLKQTQAAMDAILVSTQTFRLNWRSERLSSLRVLRNEISQLKNDLIKAKETLGFYVLRSPISGKVHDLKYHTVSGVVTPAQEIMKIIPDDDSLIVDAFIQNKDIGFIELGQRVGIKIDTFNFMKYGTIDGELIEISQDAIEDERQGLVFPIKVSFSQKMISVNGKDVAINPGMSVTAEIKTGKRRIIEFFMSPVIKHIKEGARER